MQEHYAKRIFVYLIDAKTINYYYYLYLMVGRSFMVLEHILMDCVSVDRVVYFL